MWFIDVLPLTGRFAVREADKNLSEREHTEQLHRSIERLPLWIKTGKNEAPTTQEADAALESIRVPILLLPTEEHARKLAEWLQQKFPSMPMPWSQKDAEKLLLALDCIREACEIIAQKSK